MNTQENSAPDFAAWDREYRRGEAKRQKAEKDRRVASAAVRAALVEAFEAARGAERERPSLYEPAYARACFVLGWLKGSAGIYTDEAEALGLVLRDPEPKP